jgi:predicted S18 family serine protease
MARKKSKNGVLAQMVAVAFTLGALFGLTLAAIWIQGPPVLILSSGDNYSRSMTIVGVDKSTGAGKLATVTVGLRSGSGRLLVGVPPYENEDTQQAATNARAAASLYTGRSLSAVDITVTVENMNLTTTIAGPSASAAMGVLMVAVINAAENKTPNLVDQTAVVTASIDSTGSLGPIGDVATKYSAVEAAGGYSKFIVSSGQPGEIQTSNLSVLQAGNLQSLAGYVLK